LVLWSANLLLLMVRSYARRRRRGRTFGARGRRYSRFTRRGRSFRRTSRRSFRTRRSRRTSSSRQNSTRIHKWSATALLYSGQIFTGLETNVGVSFLNTPNTPASGINPVFAGIVNTMARYDYACIDKITIFFKPRWRPGAGAVSGYIPMNQVVVRFDWDNLYTSTPPAFTSAVYRPGSKLYAAYKPIKLSWAPSMHELLATQDNTVAVANFTGLRKRLRWFPVSYNADMTLTPQARFSQFPIQMSWQGVGTFASTLETRQPIDVYCNIKYRTRDCTTFTAPTNGDFVGQEALWLEGDPVGQEDLFPALP